MNKYHFVYIITNHINNHKYVGVHNTNNLNDGYMGSGKRLNAAYQKYGIENFSRSILKFFDTSGDAFEYEKQFITEDIIKSNEWYNMKGGGDGWSNEFVKKNKVVVYDEAIGKNVQISKYDDRYTSGQLKSISTGKTAVRDVNNNILIVDTNDDRYKLGELVSVQKGKKKTKQQRLTTAVAMKKMYQEHSELAATKFAHYKNSKWIHKLDIETNTYITQRVSINDIDRYIRDGWIIGRKTNMVWINDGCTSKMVNTDIVDNYVQNGWKKGMCSTMHVSKNAGQNNPNYGKKQKQVYKVNDDGTYTNKQVSKELFDEYIKNGWMAGHKYNKK